MEETLLKMLTVASSAQMSSCWHSLRGLLIYNPQSQTLWRFYSIQSSCILRRSLTMHVYVFLE